MRQQQSANSQLIKSLNQQIVLNLIRKSGAISGADLSKTTKLQPATISKIVRALDEMGLICEAGIGESTKLGGRRPTLWQLDSGFGFVIGIEVLTFRLRGVILNFSSDIIAQEIQTYPEGINENNIAECAYEMVNFLCKAARIPRKKVIAVGLGISGVIDADAGVVNYSIALDRMKGYPIREVLEKRLRVKVQVDNDANVAAVGEKWMSADAGASAEHLIYLSVNENITGIGCGIILNGQLFRGTTGSAGELSVTLPALRELIPPSESNNHRSTSNDEAGSLTMSSLMDRANEGDEIARHSIEKLGKIIAQEIARILDFINPELVILGGDIVNTENSILQPITTEVEKLTLSLPYSAVEIKMTGFGQHAVAIGAAAIVFREIFKETGSLVRHEFNIPQMD